MQKVAGLLSCPEIGDQISESFNEASWKHFIEDWFKIVNRFLTLQLCVTFYKDLATFLFYSRPCWGPEVDVPTWSWRICSNPFLCSCPCHWNGPCRTLPPPVNTKTTSVSLHVHEMFVTLVFVSLISVILFIMWPFTELKTVWVRRITAAFFSANHVSATQQCFVKS